MKGLSQFQAFDSMAFFQDKLLKVTANGPLMDYTTKQVTGTKATVVIVEDNTVYHTKTGEQISNLYEKINVKVPGKTLTLAPGTLVELVDAKCVIYGDYRNQLSVTAADTIIDPKQAELSRLPHVITLDEDGEATEILASLRWFAHIITKRQRVLNDLSEQSGDAIKWWDAGMHPSFLFIDEYVALRSVFPAKAAKDSDYCVATFDSIIKRIVTMGASAGCYVIISIAEASVQEGGLPAMLRSAMSTRILFRPTRAEGLLLWDKTKLDTMPDRVYSPGDAWYSSTDGVHDAVSYLEAAKARDLLPMFYLELVSGLRKGELVALRWDDVDIQNRTISVSKQYVRNPDGSLELTRPKTENSVRLVSIPQMAVELLIQEHDKHPDSPYLFPSPITMEMYHPDSVVNLHKKILKDAGLPHIRFHDLRHTFATTALQNGVDVKTVSSMLGHYDAGFTLRTYTHATRQKQDEAAATMGSFMAQVM